MCRDVGFATAGHIPRGRGFDTALGYFFQINDYWTQGMSGSEGAGEGCYFLVFVRLFEKHGTLIERNTALIEKVSTLIGCARPHLVDFWHDDAPAVGPPRATLRWAIVSLLLNLVTTHNGFRPGLNGSDYEEALFEREMISVINDFASASTNQVWPIVSFYPGAQRCH
eukprot:SAG31_NODE_1232_length_9211_cov_31.167581_5_plen_168_part_00